jgi:hypothetical protein
VTKKGRSSAQARSVGEKKKDKKKEKEGKEKKNTSPPCFDFAMRFLTNSYLVPSTQI